MKSCVGNYSLKALLKLESLCLNIVPVAELVSHIVLQIHNEGKCSFNQLQEYRKCSI